MSTLYPIQRSLHYIESHLTEPATVEQAAVAAGYSRHHFSRTFLARTGLTPASYLRKRRLSEAARALVTSSQRILDIALDYQFCRGRVDPAGCAVGWFCRRMAWAADNAVACRGRGVAGSGLVGVVAGV
ncbi:MAG: helix-turn-helix domain-containing protein [Caldilineaceae bacterium]|nr:helix-turn-helix domain-containing protein [Caldilineaceae bacterium]